MSTHKDIKTWTKKPVDVEAHQIHHFYMWASFMILEKWGVPCYFVPKGFPHPLRRGSEWITVDSEAQSDSPSFVVVKTLEGDMRADALDFVIKGVKGEFYPCKPDIFEQTYVKKEES